MGNGNILIQIWPMNSSASVRPAPIGPLRLSSMNQPGKPNQGDGQASPIFQLQMELVFMNLKGLGSGSYWIEMGRCHHFLPLIPRRGFQKFLLSPGSFYQTESPPQVSTDRFREVQQKKPVRRDRPLRFSAKGSWTLLDAESIPVGETSARCLKIQDAIERGKAHIGGDIANT